MSREAPCQAWEGPTPAGGLPCEGMEGALREHGTLGVSLVHTKEV